MWERKYSKVFKNIKKETIWQIWADINNWPKWHKDLESCKLEGNFEEGNHFFLKPKGANTVKIILTEVNKGKSFTDCTKFFGAQMIDTHEMLETPEGLLLSNTLTVTGILSWLWIKLVAKNVADTVEEEMESLVKLAQEK